jgi:hypothetical protein
MKQVPPRGPTNIRRHGTKFGHLEFVNPCCMGSYNVQMLCTTSSGTRYVHLLERGNTTHTSDRRALDTLVGRQQDP